MSKYKLPPRIFSYVEHELYNYESTSEEISYMKDDIVNSSPPITDRVQSGIGNTTQSKGIQLTSNVALMRMEKTVKAIDSAMKLLGEEHAQIFHYKYKDKMDWRQVVMEIPTSQDTYFRKRRELVYMVALQMGLVSP